MSVKEKAVGIDFGSSVIAVAIVDAGDLLGAKLVSNMLSNETTPGVLKIYRDVRTVGEDAASTSTMCPKNVFSHIPLILRSLESIDELSRKYNDLGFQMTANGEEGVLFDVTDDGLLSTATLTHVTSMILNYVFKITEKNYPEYLERAVITVPSGLNPIGIRILTDAAHLAGFKDVSITNTDIAQSYNYCFRLKHSSELPEESEKVILFVDQGSCFTDIYLVRATNANCEIFYSSSQQYGAKDIDSKLFSYFKEIISHTKGIIILPGTKQAIRLCEGCRKLKEMLSSASRAVCTVDGLINGDDYQLELSRAQFEDIVRDQITTFETMMREVKASYEGRIDAVEMIGGGCRIVFMKKIVENVIGEPLRFTVDSASCIAKGAAILGLYEKTSEMLKIDGDWVLKGEKVRGEGYEEMEAMEMRLRDRDIGQLRQAEIHNQYEGLIDTMRRESVGVLSSTLDVPSLTSLLNEESDWLIDESDSCGIEMLESRFAELQMKLQTSCVKYYEAKEAKRIEIERQLEEESRQSVKDTSKEDIKLPYSQRMSRAEANKKEGTDLFKDKNYTNAAKFYKQSLIHCSKFFSLSPEQRQTVDELEKSLHLNLAQCFVKLELWEKVIDHCSTVLKTEPDNSKALYRRAFSYDKVKDVEKCAADLKAVLVMMPEDPSVKSLVSRHETEKKKQLLKRKAMAKRMFGGV